MAKRAGAFKSEKRRKELSRQKKQEEKRQRRLNKTTETRDESGTAAGETAEGVQEGEGIPSA
ncbi:MAG: hypothetical protein M1497_13385 [Nitrospirae bacterium]|nr:hypothetical protein [Nitrospirota bacterium]